MPAGTRTREGISPRIFGRHDIHQRIRVMGRMEYSQQRLSEHVVLIPTSITTAYARIASPPPSSPRCNVTSRGAGRPGGLGYIHTYVLVSAGSWIVRGSCTPRSCANGPRLDENVPAPSAVVAMPSGSWMVHNSRWNRIMQMLLREMWGRQKACSMVCTRRQDANHKTETSPEEWPRALRYVRNPVRGARVSSVSQAESLFSTTISRRVTAFSVNLRVAIDVEGSHLL